VHNEKNQNHRFDPAFPVSAPHFIHPNSDVNCLLEIGGDVMTQEELTIPPEFKIVNDRVTTTSLDVARIFERRHKDITRVCRDNITHGCITESAYKDARGHYQPMFNITSVGLVILMEHIKETEFTLSRFEYFGECFEKAEEEFEAENQRARNEYVEKKYQEFISDKPNPEEWQQTWDKMSETFSMVRTAVTNLYDDVNAMTKVKKLTSIEGRYSELKNAARKIQFLETMMMWFSPRATCMNMHLNENGDVGIK
jgi:phage regulator Rha-like protein